MFFIFDNGLGHGDGVCPRGELYAELSFVLCYSYRRGVYAYGKSCSANAVFRREARR